MILLLLALWGGAGAWWFLSRPDGRSADSIGSFRHQLRVLERTGPTTVAPAYRMASDDLGVYGASRVPAMSVPGRALASTLASTQAAAAARRRRVQKRRRDVFSALAASVAGSALLGLLPGLSAMWLLAAVLSGVLVLYVVALLQSRAADAARAERARKVRYLPGDPATRPQATQAWYGYGDAGPGYLLHRSAN